MMERISWFVQSYIQRNMALLIVVLVVLLVRLLMKRMPKKYVYCLWAIVGIRMLFSFQIVSPVSIYQFFPWADPQSISIQVALRDGEENLSNGERDGSPKKDLAALEMEANSFSEADTDKGAARSADGAGRVDSSIDPSELYESHALLANGNGSEVEPVEGDTPVDSQENDAEGETELAQGGKDLAQGNMTGAEPSSGAVIGMQNTVEGQTALSADDTFQSQTSEDTLQGLQQTTEKEQEQTKKAGESALLVFAGEQVVTRNQFVSTFFAVWLIGFLAVLGIGMVSYARIRRLVKEAVHLEENVWECDGIATPFVLGILRPRIFVPFHLEEGKRNLALEHERQHLRNLDPFARLMAYVLLAAYWMNPLVWTSYFCFVRDQEMRCDEAVLSKLGEEHKKEYGMTLLAFATEEHFVGFSPVAFGESDAEKRIKNVLNYKKPSFWAIMLGIAIVVCLAVICLTNAKKNNGAGQEPTDQTEEADSSATDVPQEEKTDLNEALYHLTVLADLDGDGESENVYITDYARGQTTLQVNLHGIALKDLELKTVDMIKTQGVAADLDGDGKEELVLLQSSPILASTYNWPGKVTILQVRDGEWRQLNDELFYPETGEYVYQEDYPKHISDHICIGVRIETMPDGMRLHLLYGMSQEEAHGMGGVLRLDCTYQAQPKEGWQVQYAFTGHDYFTNVSQLQSKYHEIYGITVGEEPGETSALEESLANKLFYSVPLQYFEGNAEADGLGRSLSVSENGSFMGIDVKSGVDQTQICEFTGAFTNARRVNGRLYLLTVGGLTYPDENYSYKQGDVQYLTMKPVAMADGDRYLLYVPGYPVAELPYKVIRALEDQGMSNWYNYALEELPCHVLLNLDQGTIYLSGYSSEYVGQRMETVGLYGDLSYPCGTNGSFSFKSVTRLCADACGLFVQKVAYPSSASKSYSELVRNEQLAEYLEYKAKHFVHRFSVGASWLLETKAWDYVTVDGKRALHVTCIPKYKYGSAQGSWGTIHFLIDMENGQHYIRDWYWDNPDSLDLAWRGAYSVEEAYDFWDHPVNYKEILKKEAQQIDLSGTVFGLPVTCAETWNNPENPTHYERRYYCNDILVGKSLGYGESRDYVDDLDGDGITELICYARDMEGQDYGDITVFRRIGNSIYMGRLTEYGSLELPNVDTLSATRRITQHYDPEDHCLYLTYPVQGGDYTPVPFTYDNMKFTEYSYIEPQANSWKEAYANYIRRSEYQAFSLIYLDDDEVPELYCQEGNYPRRIVSLQDGKLVERPLERNGFCYLEKKGIYFTSGGNMGEFPMEIVQLRDGEFIILASGYQKSEYIASAESTNPDQTLEFIKYDWNGQSVTEEEYNQKIDAIIERRSAAEPKTFYTPDEMLTLLGMEIMSLAVG